MRGKGVRPVRAPADLGITPAYAGKSRTRWGTLSARWDHPRLCGEKSSGIVTSVPFVGSPPPMRGKALAFPCICTKLRITPAYAGKRHAPPAKHSVKRDHPRLCGEKLLRATLGAHPSRITPAYAGKSCHVIVPDNTALDHPRLCGEKKSFRGKSQSRIGSPPPMRGKGSRLFTLGIRAGITPAYAGKS